MSNILLSLHKFKKKKKHNPCDQTVRSTELQVTIAVNKQEWIKYRNINRVIMETKSRKSPSLLSPTLALEKREKGNL